MADRKVKMKLGYPPHIKEVEITLPDEEPKPWDLDSKLNVMGKRHQKVDAEMKVTGAAKYTHDINLPGMLFGGFVRSKHARARIVNVDGSRAEKHPDVKATMSMAGRASRYAGQPLFAIAAETRQALEEAIALVEVEYEVLPHAARKEQALADDAPQVHGNRDSNLVMSRASNVDGADKALGKAAKKVDITCTTQVQNHCCLEPHGTVAKFENSQFTIWTSTQATFGVRSAIARHFRNRDGVDTSAVTVIGEFMGGGFGSKFSAGYWNIAAAEMALISKRPVKMMLNRREELTDTGNRPDSVQEMTMGLAADGKIAGYKIKKWGTPGVGRRAGITNPMIYDIDRRTTSQQSGEVATNAGQQAAFRAPGHPQGSFGLEMVMETAADAAGIDPLTFRTNHDSHPMRLIQYAEGAKRIGWNKRQSTGSQKGRFRIGYGVAAGRWGGMGGPNAEALCRVHADGSVEIRNGAQDIGVGTRTVMAIVCAEELGLTPSDIRTFIGNTNDPIGPGSGGSQMTASLAPAVRQAAFLVGGKLRELVAAELGCEHDELLFKGGRIQHVNNQGEGIAFKDACRLIREGQLSAIGKRPRTYGGRRSPNTEGGIWQREVGGVQFAKVTVDADFGSVKVDRIVALQDCGKIINYNTAEGQLYGGVIQGISFALFEERHMDRHLGFMINSDMENYKIAGTQDMPEIEAVLYDVSNGGNNCSVAGIGEPAMVPTAAAIGCAVRNALGVPVKSLPITPDKVLTALEEGGK